MSDTETKTLAPAPTTNGTGAATEMRPARTRALFLGDLHDTFLADCAAAAKARRDGTPRGPITGLRELDKALGGSLAAGVHLVQAAPGAGKTALKLQIACDCGFPAVYVTAEMPPLELLRRVIARQTGTYLGRIKDGEVAGNHARQMMTEVAQKVPHLVLLDATSNRVTPQDILDAAEALRQKTGKGQVLIAVDSLQVWAKQVAEGNQAEYDAINAGIRALCGIAAMLNSPILASSHRNRQGQQTGGLHAGKGSGDLEYMAETVLDLDAKDRTAGEPTWAVNLMIHKNRHGEVGVEIPLTFEGRKQDFKEA